MLEHFVREDLNKRAPRVMAVLRPLKVVIDNYPEDQVEEMDAVNNPEDESAGTRKVPFSRVLYIEQDDFREVPPPKYFRLSPGREVRLRYGYFVTCTSVVKNEKGEVVEVHCTYDPATPRRQRSRRPQGEGDDSLGLGRARGRRRGAASTKTCSPKKIPSDVEEGKDVLDNLNPELARDHCRRESRTVAGERRGRERAISSSAWDISASILTRSPGKPVFNRTVALKDTWAKAEKKQGVKG